MRAIAERMIRKHEGFRSKPYLCSAGKLTVGYGRNLEARGVSADEAALMLANDVDACLCDLATYSFWADLSPNRKAALTDLRFNLGQKGFSGFRKMLGALREKDYQRASDEILDSLYAAQVGERAITIADIMVTG